MSRVRVPEGVPDRTHQETDVLIVRAFVPNSERKAAKRLCEEEEGQRSDMKFLREAEAGRRNEMSAVWPDDTARWSSG